MSTTVRFALSCRSGDGTTAVTALAYAGVVLWLLLATPGMRELLEQHLVTHCLVQLPLLVLAGWLIGGPIAPRLAQHLAVIDRAGLSGLVVGFGILAFWMLPRSIDAALIDGRIEAFKLVSLPLGLGLVLRLDWRRLPLLLRGVIRAQLVAMALFLAWLYTAAPVRLCNSYLESEQAALGQAFFVLAAALAVLWGGAVLVGRRPGKAAERAPDGAGERVEDDRPAARGG